MIVSVPTVAYDVTYVDVFCAIMTFLYWMFLLMTKVYPNPVTLRSGAFSSKESFVIV